MTNKDSWNTDHLVKDYINYDVLQKPEKTIFDTVRGKLGNWRMLDIGIGLGRTTIHFAPYIKEYVGIDYSNKMIETYKKIFPEERKNTLVQVGDVRSMQEFAANSFDFVLFSFNGIDYISHEDRIKALEEIKRVGKKGGLFVFSTHNLQYINNIYTIKHNNSLKYFLYQCYRYLRLIFHNGLPGKYRETDFAILNDGAHHFSITTYYIKPAAQIDQLERLGFRNIRLFSLKTGEEFKRSGLNMITQDSWIYYLCEFA